MLEKTIDTSAPIHDLLAQRWSGRAFDASKDISDEQLRSLCEAGRWSPSCFNEQPWRLLFCLKSANDKSWERAFDCLWPANQAWCDNAVVLAINCFRTRFSHNDQPNPWAMYDAGAAGLSICLQATALGLMTHQMAGFDAGKARHHFSIPDIFTPVSMMAIGYQAAADAIPAALEEKEKAARQRNPLDQQFFVGEWPKQEDAEARK